MIYSFSNTTSYSTFYALFSSFRITLWPMWLGNCKRQPCFYPPQSHAQEDTRNWQKKKTDRPDRKPVLCQRNSVQFFVQFFLYIFKLHSLTYSVLVPLQAILSYRRRPARFSCCWNRKCSIICKLKICKLALILRNPWKQRGIFHCILTLFIPQLCNHFITKYQSLLYYSECVYIYIFIYLHHVLLGSKWALTSTVRNRRVSNWVNGQVQLSGLASRRSCCW